MYEYGTGPYRITGSSSGRVCISVFMIQLYRAVVRKNEAFVSIGLAKPLQDFYHLRLPVGRQTGHQDGGPVAREGLELDRERRRDTEELVQVQVRVRACVCACVK